MPSYGGESIFGAACKMSCANEPRGTQVNAFFGTEGLEALDGGSRGRVTQVTGILFGDSPSDCGAAVEDFRSYDDGIYRTLVDTSGTSWADVRLASFQPGPGFAHTQLGYCRAYTATFVHLT